MVKHLDAVLQEEILKIVQRSSCNYNILIKPHNKNIHDEYLLLKFRRAFSTPVVLLTKVITQTRSYKLSGRPVVFLILSTLVGQKLKNGGLEYTNINH